MNWKNILPEKDLEVYKAAGYGGEFELGTSPALLIIDTTYDFTGDKPEPILDSVAKFPNSSGEIAWEAVWQIQKLLATFRERKLPIFYTKGPEYYETDRLGNWAHTQVRMGDPPQESKEIGTKIVEEVAPIPGETVIVKDKPSAFFGTGLPSYLIRHQVDTVFITGGTTSGCVRATAIDAFSYNFKVGVVTDAVFDRGVLPHQINLFDMQSKYANLLTAEEVINHLHN